MSGEGKASQQASHHGQMYKRQSNTNAGAGGGGGLAAVGETRTGERRAARCCHVDRRTCAMNFLSISCLPISSDVGSPWAFWRWSNWMRHRGVHRGGIHRSHRGVYRGWNLSLNPEHVQVLRCIASSRRNQRCNTEYGITSDMKRHSPLNQRFKGSTYYPSTVGETLEDNLRWFVPPSSAPCRPAPAQSQCTPEGTFVTEWRHLSRGVKNLHLQPLQKSPFLNNNALNSIKLLQDFYRGDTVQPTSSQKKLTTLVTA